MTVAYRPTRDVFEKYKKYLGQTVSLHAIKHCFDNRCQAVLVDTNLSENDFPHITLSCTEEIEPVYANKIFQGSVECEPLKMVLSGIVEVVKLN